jgi:hypothetical protein
MDLTLYQKMIGATNTSLTQAYINDTIVHVNDIFDKSPTFKQIQVNDTPTDCIINHTKKSTVLDLLFRPKSVLNKGMYVLIDSNTYMVTDFVPNEIYPKAIVELCNSTLKWKDSSGTLKEYKCIVTGSTYDENQDKQVFTSDSKLIVLVQYNDDTKTIKPTQRFVFGENAYEVETIDAVSSIYNGVGIIKFGVKFTSVTATDDTTNQVADDSGNSGWGSW